MILHILNSPNHIHVLKFLKFIEDNFDPGEHVFIFTGRHIPPSPSLRSALERYDYDKMVKKIEFMGSLCSVPRLIGLLRSSKMIILHGKVHIFPDFPGVTLFSYPFYKMFLKKSLWMIWSADLYNYRKPASGLRDRMHDGLRKGIIRNIPRIGCMLKEDFVTACNAYGSTARYVELFYPSPLEIRLMGGDAGKATGNERRTILLGHSADPENQHIESLKMLMPLSREDIRIICPLSYGKYERHIKEVIDFGTREFPGRFEPLTEFLPPDEYTSLLGKVDIAIMNHRVQKALGNILALLYLGKKVFIRRETTTFEFLERVGVKVYGMDELDLSDISRTFYMEPRTAEANRKVIENLLSEERCKELWGRAFKEAGV